MVYAVLKVINGTYSVHAEGITNLDSAKISYHGLCQVLWNAPDVITGTVAIVNENLCVIEPYREYITHSVETPEEDTPEDA